MTSSYPTSAARRPNKGKTRVHDKDDMGGTVSLLKPFPEQAPKWLASHH